MGDYCGMYVWDGLTEVGEMTEMHWHISETTVKFLLRVVVLISKSQNGLEEAKIWARRKAKYYARFHLSLEFLHSIDGYLQEPRYYLIIFAAKFCLTTGYRNEEDFVCSLLFIVIEHQTK